uniref:Uncharacterized protein n=1 Tax=candidate division CPR3 bacterium TaxID=2268181 RepID=A0A7C4R4S0_UNCC3
MGKKTEELRRRFYKAVADAIDSQDPKKARIEELYNISEIPKEESLNESDILELHVERYN